MNYQFLWPGKQTGVFSTYRVTTQHISTSKLAETEKDHLSRYSIKKQCFYQVTGLQICTENIPWKSQSLTYNGTMVVGEFDFCFSVYLQVTENHINSSS